jgi:hypothetical protein
MIEFMINLGTGNLSTYRSCPTCDAYLVWRCGEETNLRMNQFLKQKEKKDRSGWYHTTQAGRSLHKISTRKKEEGLF